MKGEPGSGGVDDDVGGDDLVALLPPEGDEHAVAGVLDAGDRGGTDDLEAVVLFVLRVVVGDDVFGGQ